MLKTYSSTIGLFAASMILAGSAVAQQTPATSPQSPATPPAAKAAPSTVTKTAPGTAAKPHPASATRTAVPLVLKTDKDKSSYALGLFIGKNLHMDPTAVDSRILLRGLQDAMAGGKTLLTDDEMKDALTTLKAEMQKKQEEKMQAAGAPNQKEGEAFLAANKAKEGVVTLPSGLQYKILTQGSGPKPTLSDTVVCNYKGTLLNGTEFDSSYKRGQPASFAVGQVIKGWTEALQLMPVGSKWQLFIPAELAYGTRGAGPDIAPNATLIFEVELISIQGK
jgi:FKBP-type peptidyl-prolyl cis-trans isomerase FklB